MHSETSTSPFLGHALPSGSTLQHPRRLTCEGDCHLEHRHFVLATDCGPATADVCKSQCLASLTGVDYSVSISERALQSSSCPIIPAPLLVRNSSLVGHLSGEPDSAQVALLLGCVSGENRASSIHSSLVDHARGYWVARGHASDYITNHDTTFLPSYTGPLLPYAIEQSLRYPQESGDVSTFGDLDNSFVGPTMGLGLIPSLHDCTCGQVIGSDSPWSRLPNPLLPSLHEPHPLDDFTIGNIPLPPEQGQIEIVVPPQFPPGFTSQLAKYTRPRTPFPPPAPIPSQCNSTSYSTSDGYVSSYPSFPIPNQNSFSWFPQEHLGYPFPVHPCYMRPADLLGLHGPDVGGKMDLHTSGIFDDRTAQVLNDQSCTFSDNKPHPFRNHSAYIPDDNTAGGGVVDYGNFDESKFNSEQVVGLSPQTLLPLNHLPLPSRKLHSHARLSLIEDRSHSGTYRHTRRSAAQSRITTRLPKARSVCDRNVSNFCGWRDNKGRKCGTPISYDDCADHFAAAHDIKDIAWNVRLICRWCFSEPQKEVIRKNLLRHLREVHLYYPRSENGI